MKIIRKAALIIKGMQINYICDIFIYLLASQSKINARKITTVRRLSLTLLFQWEYKLTDFSCRKKLKSYGRRWTTEGHQKSSDMLAWFPF